MYYEENLCDASLPVAVQSCSRECREQERLMKDRKDEAKSPQSSFKSAKSKSNSGAGSQNPNPAANALKMDWRPAKRKKFSNVSTVLNTVISKLGLDKRLKEHTFMSLWPAIVGDVFGSRSRPLFIDSEKSLVVAVKDASVGQELSLYKVEILKKLKLAGKSVGVEISGLRFDLKHYGRPAEVHSIPDDSRPIMPEPSEQELKNVVLVAEDLDELAGLTERLRMNESEAGPRSDGMHAASPERILSVFERELRLRRWRMSNGCPACQRCGTLTARFFGGKRLCSLCYIEEVST